MSKEFHKNAPYIFTGSIACSVNSKMWENSDQCQFITVDTIYFQLEKSNFWEFDFMKVTNEIRKKIWTEKISTSKLK